MLEFPPDEPIGERLSRAMNEGGTSGGLPPPDGSPAHVRAVARIKADLVSRASRLDKAAEVLRRLVLAHDPLVLIPSISVPTGSAVWSDGTRVDDAEHTYTWDAKIEYLAGLVLSGPPGEGAVDQRVSVDAIELTARVFDSAQAGLFLWSVEEGVSDNPVLDLTSYLMRVEHLIDRMHGYAVHLEEINDAVFEPHRGMYVDALGFCPSDVVRLVRRHSRWMNDAIDRLGRRLGASEELSDEAKIETVCQLKAALDAACLWNPVHLADTTGLRVDQLAAMLELMSTEFGVQPDFRLPSDENILRKRPFIRVDDAYLVPLPWSPAHSVHEWLVDYLQREPNTKLRDTYLRDRSDAAERLVRTRLARIFGESVVHANQHYDGAEGHGEIDCLVAGGTPMVVEVKSQSVTDPGRKGSRARLERVSKDLLGRSFDQTRRAAEYIDNGGRTFASKEGEAGRLLLHDEVVDAVQVVVSFEGIDPLAISAAGLIESETERPVWVTDLADFLMVGDVLWDPASFLHYARKRSDPSRAVAYIESDALVAYLERRLEPGPGTTSDVGANSRMLTYNSGRVNDYYTKLRAWRSGRAAGTRSARSDPPGAEGHRSQGQFDRMVGGCFSNHGTRPR